MQTTNDRPDVNGPDSGASSSERTVSPSSDQFNGLQVEPAVAIFFDDNALREPAYFLFRADGGASSSARWYFEPEARQYYASVTSVISATQPTPYGLLEWLKANGSRADDIRDLRAAYGTWLHVQIARLLIERELDLEEAVESIPDPSLIQEGQKDLLAFEAFRRQHSVEPLGVEVVLKSDQHGIAGAIDLPCKMRIGSGKGGNWLKSDAETGGIEITAIVDFKSGKKGFYSEHGHQLRMYRAIWNENFPEAPIDRVFNWSPADWRSAPSWKLKEWTEADSSWELMAKLFHAQNTHPTPRLAISGRISEGVDLSDLYRFESIEDLVTGTTELDRDLADSIAHETEARK